MSNNAWHTLHEFPVEFLDGRTMDVVFEYFPALLQQRLKKRRKSVICQIRDTETGFVLYFGRATYNPKDEALGLPFDPDEGQKIAFRRAVAVLPSELKPALFEAFVRRRTLSRKFRKELLEARSCA